MPGSFCSSATVEGNLPPSLGDGDRAFVQVAGAAVVAKPRPGGEHVVERRRGERLDGRPAGEEAQITRLASALRKQPKTPPNQLMQLLRPQPRATCGPGACG